MHQLKVYYPKGLKWSTISPGAVKRKASHHGQKSKKKRPPDKSDKNLIVVGIGASAGGLEAFEQFFTHLPTDSTSGLAFVLVQHLSPNHKSILVDLVKRYTRMQVYEVEDGVTVQPNCVYIIPPNKNLALLHGKLHLMELDLSQDRRLPIDYFFRSLAQDQREQAVCIILTGTGTDGTLGLKFIKEAGGVAIVQDPTTAKYDGMPRSAIATGLVDYILPPDKMPVQLLAYTGHKVDKELLQDSSPSSKKSALLQKVFIQLRSQTGHDFSYYKHNTIWRRIERRMAVNQIEQLTHYIRYLQQTPKEVELLFRDLLIGVTNFFRDPDAFEILKKKALLPLLKNKPAGGLLRIWIPGCSTGEEAYSIAMLLQEQMDESKHNLKVQIFATDIDRRAIDIARSGIYPQNITSDVSAERLRRFFDKDEDAIHYNIKKSVRDMVVFAEQNVIEDPPFSKIDLISCRNLLIYLGPELQKKVIPLFHYALNPQGFLFLGSSESIGDFRDLFTTLERKWKLYQAKVTISSYSNGITFPVVPVRKEGLTLPAIEKDKKVSEIDLPKLVKKTLLKKFSPACVIINQKGEVLYIHGSTGKYLEPASGKASLNIHKMSRKGLGLKLAAAIRQAIAQKEPVYQKGVKVELNEDVTAVNLSVIPVLEPPSMQDLLMIVFEETPANEEPEGLVKSDTAASKEQRIADLERELTDKEEHLQITIEELETSNEELTSTNEELQSTNEELQSANEELETSKEELQSINEELVTVNTEMQSKIDELSRTNNDMNNLLAGTDIGTIFVDHQLNIVRFTPNATRIINLIQTDIGRPVGHIASNLVGYSNLTQDIQEVLDHLIPKEEEVQSKEGLWYLMRILPYRTLKNVIEGAVITFVEITEQVEIRQQLRELSDKLEQTRNYAENIVNTVREPLLILDANLRVVSANHSFYNFFKVTPEETEEQLIYSLGNGQWDIPKLRQLLETIISEHTSFNDYKINHNFADIGQKTLLLNAREIQQQAGQEPLILLAIEDITEV